MKRLGYYTSQFPFPQGRSAGPYAMFLQPPNASLMRVRVACVAVGQQIGQPAKPNLKMQRACRCKRRTRCGCHRRGLGQDMPTYDATPLTPAQVEQGILTPPVSVDTTGTYNYGDLTAPAGPTDAYGNPIDLTGGSGSPTAGLPSGSQLAYNATWGSQKAAPANAQVIGWTASTAVESIRATLASQNVVIDSYSGSGGTFSSSSGYSLSLSVHTTGDFNQLADVKSIIDHAIYAQVSGVVPQSTLVATALATPNTPGDTSTTSWLQDNWQWLALAAGGFLVLDKVL